MSRFVIVFAFLLVFESGCKRCVQKQEATSEAPPAQEAVVQPAPEVPTPTAPATALDLLVNTGSWVATASSQEAALSPKNAIDGLSSTRWSSLFKDDEWWMVDFGREELVSRVALTWETAFARSYEVLVSTNGTDWVTVYKEPKGNSGTKIISFEPRLVRQVKVRGIQRGTQWGFSLLDVAFNVQEPEKIETTASSGGGDYGSQFAVDGRMDTRWCSGFGDSEWWQVRFPTPRVIAGLKLSWETAFAEKYQIWVSADGKEWKTVYDVAQGDGRTDILFFKPVECQFVRVACSQRGTGWGNSLYEVEFYDKDKTPKLTATSSSEGAGPENAADGDPSTMWHSLAAGEQTLTVQLPGRMALGGMELLWSDPATRYTIEASTDGAEWKQVFEEKNGNGARDYIFFAATEAQYVRIACHEGPDSAYAIKEMEFKSGEEQARPILAYQAKARDATPGRYPMWLIREQEFWTVTGVEDDEQESLIGETGTIEPHKGDFCVMPFVFAGGQLVTWADVKLDQRLEEDMLPMPSVTWTADGWKLDVSAVAYGPANQASTAARYRLTNTGSEPLRAKLGLAIRPFQLNPIWQHGGMSPIAVAECTTNSGLATLRINGKDRVVSLTPPSGVGAAPLGEGDIVDYFARGEVPAAMRAEEPDGKTSAGFLYELEVPAGESRDVVVVYLLHDQSAVAADFAAAPAAGFEKVWAERRAAWGAVLTRVVMDIPEKRLIDVLKSNLGYVLINRDAPWFKPGSRNYNHAWTRDGALTGWAMLRLGKPELSKAYISKFSEFIGESGWVPHMILEEGNPVTFNSNPNSGEGQEYDSQGEFVFIVRQYFDYSGDEELLRRVYPKVVKALRFAQELRKRRMTDVYRDDPADLLRHPAGVEQPRGLLPRQTQLLG